MPRKDVSGYEDLRARVASLGGKAYWRTLDELAGTPEFQEYLHREFPQAASEWNDSVSRRGFLKLMGASLALAGLGGGCMQQDHERIVPYVEMPEDIIPGKPLYFATAMEFGGLATGLLVESHMGRPTKIEGNPDHPTSRGSTDPFNQASILTMYDPDRAQVVKNAGTISTPRAFRQSLASRLAALRNNGAGLRVLTESVSSPTLIDQMERLQALFPQMQWHHWEPVFNDTAREGNRLAFGEEAVHALYRFEAADVVLSLDADFLAAGTWPLIYARQFMRKRAVANDPPDEPRMNRLYVAATTPTLTGAKADHRLTMRRDQLVGLALAVAERVGADINAPQGLPDPPVSVEEWEAWVDALVEDLEAHRGRCLVVAGFDAPPVVQALAHAMNVALENVGRTVAYTEPVLPHPTGQLASLRQLVADMRAGEVEVLVMLGGNPVFTAPADLDFAEALRTRVPFRVHLSLYEDETSWLCQWHVPQRHYLEEWGDVRAFEGTPSLMQPLINPLYDSCLSAYDLLSILLGASEAPTYDVVRDYWRRRYQGDDFEEFWRRSLHRGTIEIEGDVETVWDDLPPDEGEDADVRNRLTAQPRLPRKDVSLQANFADEVTEQALNLLVHERGTFQVVLRPDPSIWDGRFANNGWLQELPKPLTKLVWDNAALVSPATFERHGWERGALVDLEHDGKVLRLPAFPLPGQPDDCITVNFGYGRTRVGRVGNEVGFDVYPFRTSENPWFVPGVRLRTAGGTYPLATTQNHHLLDADLSARHIMVSGTLHELQDEPEHPHFMHAVRREDHPSMYPEWDYEGYKWGMVINQTTCVGCNACVVACQAENNVPVVGKEEVLRAREMHWLRIDTYYSGDLNHPETYFQPMLCQHCEKAPCEVVCPVAATSHSAEGLNEMTYNRCVGTRFCSNNCPYKVRRFNFFEYTQPIEQHPVLQLLQNPDVTVRSRGVMEKCTYCVQRINHFRIETEKEALSAEQHGRPQRPQMLETACQAACPTEAIVFGDLNRDGSLVARLREHPINYAVLGDLNTQPRTTYMAAMTNPHPNLVAARTDERHA